MTTLYFKKGHIVEFEESLDILDLKNYNLNPEDVVKIEISSDSSLGFNNIENFEGASILTNVEYIMANGTNLKSLKGIEGLYHLKHLNVSESLIDSLEELKDLHSLKYLFCSYNYIKSLEGLQNLKELSVLDISDNNVVSLNPIKDLVNLSTLKFSGNNIEDIEDTLFNLVNLQILECNFPPGFSFKTFFENGFKNGLENPFLNLRTLICSGSDLVSLKGIENMTSLEILDIQSNEITSLEELSSLKNLKELYCNENRITSLKGIENLTALEFLECDSNEITSIKEVRNLRNLQELNCSHNLITSLPIELTSLRRLHNFSYQGNNITEIQTQLVNYLRRFRDSERRLKVYDDIQNVHDSHISKSVKDSIIEILKSPKCDRDFEI